MNMNWISWAWGLVGDKKTALRPTLVNTPVPRVVSPSTFKEGDSVIIEYDETTGNYGERLYSVPVKEIGYIEKIVDQKWYLCVIEQRFKNGENVPSPGKGMIPISIVNHPNLNPMKKIEN